MTNIRSSGFDNPAQLREHLAELDDAAADRDDPTHDNADLQRQIAQLRKEMRDLRKLVVQTRARPAGQGATRKGKDKRDDRFWLRLATTVAGTLLLSAAVRYFRLGPAGAAAVPLIASKFSGGGR